jgi:hypothetical protein
MTSINDLPSRPVFASRRGFRAERRSHTSEAGPCPLLERWLKKAATVAHASDIFD